MCAVSSWMNSLGRCCMVVQNLKRSRMTKRDGSNWTFMYATIWSFVRSLITHGGVSCAARFESNLYTVDDWLARKTCAFRSGTAWAVVKVRNRDQQSFHSSEVESKGEKVGVAEVVASGKPCPNWGGFARSWSIAFMSTCCRSACSRNRCSWASISSRCGWSCYRIISTSFSIVRSLKLHCTHSALQDHCSYKAPSSKTPHQKKVLASVVKGCVSL